MKVLVALRDQKAARFLSRGLEAEGLTVERCTVFDALPAQALYRGYCAVLVGCEPLDTVLETVREIKRDRPDLCVLALADRHDPSRRLLLLRAGVDDYLAAPYSLDELVARLRGALRRLPSAAEVAKSRLGTAGIDLDLTSREVHVDGRTVHLSAVEFHLLRYLMEHSGEAISRPRLLSEVWGYGFDPSSNVVDVSILRLRRKLGDNDPIETVRGVGYRLAVLVIALVSAYAASMLLNSRRHVAARRAPAPTRTMRAGYPQMSAPGARS